MKIIWREWKIENKSKTVKWKFIWTGGHNLIR